jgi:hypothetical protein
MWIQHFIYSKVRGVPLWVIGVCGLAGVLVDLDHLFPYWITNITCKSAHKPLAIISCIILCGIGAYCGRLYIRMVLKRKRGNPPGAKP